MRVEKRSIGTVSIYVDVCLYFLYVRLYSGLEMQPVLIVALTQTKGGSGKSTIAQNLAVEAVRDGRRVLLVDLDPAQSAAKWWRRRGGPANPMLETTVRSLGTLIDAIEKKAGGPDVVILDTPGELLG